MKEIKRKNFKTFQILIIFILILPMTKERIKQFLKLNSNNEITITLKEIGEQYVVSKNCNTIPDEIYVNDKLLDKSVKKVNLIEGQNNIILKWIHQVDDCVNMFLELTNITKIDLSKFDSSKVFNMTAMFKSCSSLTSIILQNFDTSSVISMRDMFCLCSKLTSLDLTGFNTSRVQIMRDMFYDCKELKEINVKNFITSSVNDMKDMFYGCQSLTTLDLSNFDTSLVTDMSNMFQSCTNLISLNLKNFDISNVEAINNIFYDCRSLISLNLISFDTSKLADSQHLFGNVPTNVTFCLDIKKNTNILSQIEKFTNNCDNICFIESPKLLVEKKVCTYNCSETDYKYEYKDICYKNCPNNTYASSDNIFLCQYNPYGYYLDDNIYKPCYTTCNYCNGEGNEINHNCIECISNYIFINSSKYNNNCYKKCDYYYYFDSSNNYQCTINDECPEEQYKLIKNKNKCIDDCSKDDIYTYEENNLCICPISLPYEKKSECVETCKASEFLNQECKINNKNNKNAQDNIVNNIKTAISSGDLNSILSNVKDGEKKDYIIQDSDATYQITSSDNQKNYEYNNISSILLGDCEQQLKVKHGISENEALIIFKIDIKEEGLKIPIIEYEVYNPRTLEKLELDCCEDTKIGISIPVSIDEDSLFKYNSSDDYYNDICYSYTTENGTDIVIKDRQNEYVSNNMSLCESNCEYSNYNTTNKKALCECKAKGTITSIPEIKSNKEKLLNAFTDLKNAINLEVMKCFKKFFSKNGFIKNIGSYALLVIILIHIASIILFSLKGYNILYNKVQDIAKNKNGIKNEIKNELKVEKKKIKKKKKKKLISMSINNNINGEIIQIEKNNKDVSNPIQKKKRIKNKNSNRKSKNDDNISNSNTKMDLKSSEKKVKNINILYNKIQIFDAKNHDKINVTNNINYVKSELNDYELNNLDYKEALEIDKRTYFQYYWSLLRQKHLLIFTFYTYNDYNSKIIKISLFFFSFALYYTVNALFFNYTTMHKIYEDGGTFNFIFQIPQILYSTIISTVISMIVKILSLTQKNIIELKSVNENIETKVSKLLKCLTIKFLLFFSLSFLFLLFFWYYLGCFCAIYTNTQEHLIKDTTISFMLSLVYPIFLNLLPGFFRIPSLKAVNKDKGCLYKCSQIIQLI